MLLTAVPSKMIIGSASGKEERTPNIAPLLIDKALPKANKLNSKRFAATASSLGVWIIDNKSRAA